MNAGAAVFDVALPAARAHDKLVAVAGELAFVGNDERARDSTSVLHAVDLRRGTERWSVAGVEPSELAFGTRLVFVTAAPGHTLALDAATGAVARRIEGSIAGIVDDVAYGTQFGSDAGFVAYDARTAQPIWRNRAFARLRTSGAPAVLGARLLQSFVESGAITINSMHAFDVRTGRALWSRGFGPAPLGADGGKVYLDTTWFPLQLEEYIPQTIGTVDAQTGALLREVTYRPDPERNARSREDHARGAQEARVAGGYAYVEIAEAWYRYDANADAPAAHPLRIDGLQVRGILRDGALVAVSGGRLVLAQPVPGGFALGDVAPWPAIQPHADPPYRGQRPSDPAFTLRASDGRAFVAAGTDVYAIDAGSRRVRRLGRTQCAPARTMVASDSGVTLLCGTHLITFADRAAAAGGNAADRQVGTFRFAQR